MKKSLPPEVKEVLRHISSTDDMTAIYALIRQLIGNMERDVLNMDLSEKSFAHLGIMKAKLDGAKLLESRLRAEIQTLKGEKSNGRQ